MASQVYLGIALELGGKEISLEPQTAITEVKTKGIEVALPADQVVKIGGVGENLKSILDSLDVNSDFLEISEVDTNGVRTKQAKVKDLPDIQALQNSVNLLFNAQLTVEQFHVKVPPTHRVNTTGALEPIPTAQQGETKYTIGMSAIWIGDSGTLFGSLKLKGLYFKASNEGR